MRHSPNTLLPGEDPRNGDAQIISNDINPKEVLRAPRHSKNCNGAPIGLKASDPSNSKNWRSLINGRETTVTYVRTGNSATCENFMSKRGKSLNVVSSNFLAHTCLRRSLAFHNFASACWCLTKGRIAESPGSESSPKTVTRNAVVPVSVGFDQTVPSIMALVIHDPGTECRRAKQPPARDPAEPSSWLYAMLGTVETVTNHTHGQSPIAQSLKPHQPSAMILPSRLWRLI